jgi:FkbM family methyltransferase
VLEEALALPERSIKIADIGAAFFGEPAPYQPLLANRLGEVFAFEPDARQVESLRAYLGSNGRVVQTAVGDGATHTLHICNHGWTSLLEPDPDVLDFFNNFRNLGRVESTAPIATKRLDQIDEVPQIDFLKMDAQGAELMILQNGRQKLAGCLAVQSEVSFIPIYRDQPPFGALDIELRAQGFIPHLFANIKGWSIAPTMRNNDPRLPFNQLLEADVVYIRDLIRPAGLSDLQIRKLAAIAHFCYNSPDLVARCLLELQRRNVMPAGTLQKYLPTVRAPGRNPANFPR